MENISGHLKFGNTHCPSSRIGDILALPEFAKVIEGVGLKLYSYPDSGLILMDRRFNLEPEHHLIGQQDAIGSGLDI